jgi:hypothetical protein
MRVNIEKINQTEDTKEYTKYFRVVTTEEYGMFCTEVFHQKGITRAFNKDHDQAVDNAVGKAVKYLKAS